MPFLEKLRPTQRKTIAVLMPVCMIGLVHAMGSSWQVFLLALALSLTFNKQEMDLRLQQYIVFAMTWAIGLIEIPYFLIDALAATIVLLCYAQWRSSFGHALLAGWVGGKLTGAFLSEESNTATPIFLLFPLLAAATSFLIDSCLNQKGPAEVEKETLNSDTRKIGSSLNDNPNSVLTFLKGAFPLIILQFSLNLFMLVDVAIIGQLGSEQLAGVGLAMTCLTVAVFFGTGCLLGIDTLCNLAIGNGNRIRAANIFAHTLILCFIIAIPCVVLFSQIDFFLTTAGVSNPIKGYAIEYLKVAQWSLFPNFVFIASRQFLQSLNRTWSLTVLLVITNLLNYFLSKALVFGEWGLPELGVFGVAFGSVISTGILSVGSLIIVFVYLKVQKILRWPSRWDRDILLELIRLGLPAGTIMVSELAIPALVGLLAASLKPEEAAAHSVCLGLFQAFFSVPQGISFAAVSRAGQAIGKSNFNEARRVIKHSLVACLIWWTSLVLVFAIGQDMILSFYSKDPNVISAVKTVMWLVLFMHALDATQVVITAILRAYGETKVPMLINLFCYWLIALPLIFGLKALINNQLSGIWLGWGIGILFVCVSLLYLAKRVVRINSTEESKNLTLLKKTLSLKGAA